MPSTYARVIEDIVDSLHRSSNFTHFYFINGHGGNIMPFKLAQETLLLKNKVHNRVSPTTTNTFPKIKVFSWFSHSSMVSLAKSFYHEEVGQHATPDEIAITQYLYNIPGSTDRPQLNLSRHSNYTPRIRESMNETSSWQVNLLPEEEESLNRLRSMALSYMDPEQFKMRYPDGR